MTREYVIARRLVSASHQRKAATVDIVQDRISEAIRSLSYLPVEHSFQDSRQGKMAKDKVSKALSLLEEVLSDLPTPVTYTVYGLPGVGSFSDVQDFERALAAKGIRKIGVSRSQSLRKELQGQPMFDSLIGPMYDGPKKVRYETSDVNDTLSR